MANSIYLDVILAIKLLLKAELFRVILVAAAEGFQFWMTF